MDATLSLTPKRRLVIPRSKWFGVETIYPAQPEASPTAAMGLPLMNTPEEPVTIEPPQPGEEP